MVHRVHTEVLESIFVHFNHNKALQQRITVKSYTTTLNLCFRVEGRRTIGPLFVAIPTFTLRKHNEHD